MHVIRECPRHYFLTFIVYKDWPLLSRFNKLMLRIAEGGLILNPLNHPSNKPSAFNILTQEIDRCILSTVGFALLWYEQIEEAFIMKAYTHDRAMFGKRPRKPFSLKDIQTPFYFLIIGYFISFVMFMIEKFILSPDKLAKIRNYIRPTQRLYIDFEANRRRQKWKKSCKLSK